MQTRLQSVLEAITNTLTGMLVAMVTQILIFPLFNIVVPVSTNIWLVIIFTIVSVIRSYAWRRFFNGRHGQPKHPDDLAVDRFAAALKVKMARSRDKGRDGWDDPSIVSEAYLCEQLLHHCSKGNAGTFEDIGNFAMMLHQRGADPAVLAGVYGCLGLSTDPAEAALKKQDLDYFPTTIRQLASDMEELRGQRTVLVDALRIAEDYVKHSLSSEELKSPFGEKLPPEHSMVADLAAITKALEPYSKVSCRCILFGKNNPHWPCTLHPAAEPEQKTHHPFCDLNFPLAECVCTCGFNPPKPGVEGEHY